MGRVEILTGRERRRIWSDDLKLTILEEVATSGLTVADVARRHDVPPQQIYAWRRKFAQDQRERLGTPSDHVSAVQAKPGKNKSGMAAPSNECPRHIRG